MHRLIVLGAVGVLTCLDQIPVIGALSDSAAPSNPIRLVATARAETNAECPAVMKPVPAGPLAELATRALVGTHCTQMPMMQWVAELYGFAKPGHQPPDIKFRGVSGTNERGKHGSKGFMICLDCVGLPMIFTDGNATFLRLYLTYPDGTLRTVYDKTKGSSAVPVPANAEEDYGFEVQVRYWKEELNRRHE